MTYEHNKDIIAESTQIDHPQNTKNMKGILLVIGSLTLISLIVAHIIGKRQKKKKPEQTTPLQERKEEPVVKPQPATAQVKTPLQIIFGNQEVTILIEQKLAEMRINWFTPLELKQALADNSDVLTQAIPGIKKYYESCKDYVTDIHYQRQRKRLVKGTGVTTSLERPNGGKNYSLLDHELAEVCIKRERIKNVYYYEFRRSYYAKPVPGSGKKSTPGKQMVTVEYWTNEKARALMCPVEVVELKEAAASLAEA